MMPEVRSARRGDGPERFSSHCNSRINTYYWQKWQRREMTMTSLSGKGGRRRGVVGQAVRRHCPPREDVAAGSDLSWVRWGLFVLLAGYLLFAHGCHGDDDNELFAAFRDMVGW